MSRKFTQSNKLFKKVKQVIPLASQTFSKSYLQFIKGNAPLFLTHGKGVHVWDVDGNEYIDFINGLAAVWLGYQYPAVDKAIEGQLKKGINASLPTELEYELAQLLIKYIPCAEMVRFGKNGSDATTGAVRLARAVTGRDHIICCGYHGWHDWYIGSTTRKLGVPESTQALTHTFEYNNINSLKKIFKQYKNKIAAVIMEPISYIEPENDFLQKVKKTAHQNGALLVFDEIVTGFRCHLGGAQKLFNVIPDLACFGKSMANGMPVSVLAGKKKYMKHIEDIFYSFTFGGENLSLTASIATIKEIKKKKVIKHVNKIGFYLKNETNKIIKDLNLDDIIELKGRPDWQVFIINDYKKYSSFKIKSYLQQEILQAGFLWYGQHVMSFSHTKKDVDKLLVVYKKIFKKLKYLLKNDKLNQCLKGKPISDIFKIR